jgi:hypothetical protein
MTGERVVEIICQIMATAFVKHVAKWCTEVNNAFETPRHAVICRACRSVTPVSGRGRREQSEYGPINRPTLGSYNPPLTLYSCHSLAATTAKTGQGDVSQSEGMHL